MKNTIKYYYDLEPDVVHQVNKEYKFEIGIYSYIFTPYLRAEDELKDLHELSVDLISKGLYCHQFVPNNNGYLITFINDIQYVLLIMYNNNDLIANLDDILFFSNSTITNSMNNLRRDNWHSLWGNKIDYFEYQINQFGKSRPLIRESFSYFIGLAETSISFIKNINNSNVTLSVSHRRVNKDTTIADLYNPLNFIIDNKVRDVCEYFKSRFYDGYDIYDDIIAYINNGNLTSTDCLILYARMLFPTYYFDIFERIIITNNNEQDLIPIIGKVNEYESLLNKLHIYIKGLIIIPDIDWLLV